MKLMGCFKIGCPECQMEFALSKIIVLGMILDKSQLQLKITLCISHIGNNKAFSVNPSFFCKSKCFFIKSKGFLDILQFIYLYGIIIDKKEG